jgi:MFS family permease
MQNYSSTTTMNNGQIAAVPKYYPIVVILLCSLFLFFKYVIQVFPSIMTDDLMRTFETNATGLGVLAGAYFWSYTLMQFFAGIIIDRFNARWLAACAIAISAIGLIAFSATTGLNAAVFDRVLMGLGAAFATITYMKMASIWFSPARFAFVGGLLTTAVMAGAIFGEVPLAYMFNSMGWHQALQLCGFLAFGIAALFIFFVRDDTHQLNTHHSLTESISNIWKVFKNGQNWILLLFEGFAFTPLVVFTGVWGNPFLEAAYNVTPMQAGSLTTLVFFGLAIGGPLLGLLSDYIKERRKVMVIGHAIALISLIIVLYVPLPYWLLGTLLFIFGFSTGVFMICFAIGKDINSLMMAGTVIAMINSGDAIMISITEPLVGKFLDLGWDGAIVNGVHHFTVQNYHHAMFILPCFIFFAIIGILSVKKTGIYDT